MRKVLFRCALALVVIVALMGLGSLAQSVVSTAATTTAEAKPVELAPTVDHSAHDHFDYSLSDSRSESIVKRPRKHVRDVRSQNSPQHPREHAIPSIDGKTDPDAIPDDHALSLLYRTATRTDENGMVDDRRLRAYLRHVFGPLSPEEIESALDIVKEFRPQMEAFDRRSALDRTQRVKIAQDRFAVLRTFATKLELSFGPNGGQRLAQGLLQVKRNTRVFRRAN